ncbi:MAG TPA: hypothetical protein VKH34_08430 [Vicinamibacterales bacterium]|nr:hypothetical protein [Vicinamibacterales bacterium]
MDAAEFAWSVFLLAGVVVFLAVAFNRRRGGHGMSGPGAGAYGAVYDLLNEDKRNAIEMIVEDKAASRDPEDADGNLPDLANPKRRPK